MYLLSDMVNRASINDSQQFGQVSKYSEQLNVIDVSISCRMFWK